MHVLGGLKCWDEKWPGNMTVSGYEPEPGIEYRIMLTVGS